MMTVCCLPFWGNTFNQVTSTAPWDFNINIGVIWACRWPRPKHLDTDALCSLAVSDGRLEVGDLGKEAAARPGGTCSRWMDMLQPHLKDIGGEPFVDLVVFLTTFMTNKIMKPLYGQVVWNLGAAFEQTLGRILQEKEEPNDYLKKNCVRELDGVIRQGIR